MNFDKAKLKPLTPEDREILQRHFNSLDNDNNGRIDEQELRSGLQKVGFHFPENIIHRMMVYYCDDSTAALDSTDVKLNFEGFVELSNFLDYMRVAFQKVDVDGNGHIDCTELGSALLDLGYNLTRQHIKFLLAAVDHNRSGTIEFEEFVDLSFYLSFLDKLSKRGSNHLNATGLSELLKTAGMLVSPNDVKEVLKNKKQLTFSDFVSLVFVVEQKSMRKSSGAGQTTPPMQKRPSC